MKVCIIIPPAYGLFDQRSNVPLGPLYAAAQLKHVGADVELISLLGRKIPAIFPQADLYMMGFTTPQLGACVGLLNLIRAQYPEAKVVAAGAHPTFKPHETLAAGFDSVISGEAESALGRIIHDFQDHSLYISLPRSDLDNIPFPARELLPRADLHNRVGSMFLGDYENESVTSIVCSRGCPNHCAFCGNSPQGGLRYRSAANVVAELVKCLDMGISCFKFQDDSFTIRKDKVIELGDECQKVLGRGAIHVRAHTRADMLSEELMPALKRIGVEIVGLGIESGSQEILDISKKGIKIGQAERALRLAKSCGFKTLGFFMFGLPWESERTVNETIEFLRRNKPYLDGANLTTFVPYPGCDIAENPEEYKMHILDHDYNNYWVTEKRTIFALPQNTSFDEMRRLEHLAYGAFAELGYAKKAWEHDK